MGKAKDKMKGVLEGLEDNERIKEDKNKKVEKEKSKRVKEQKSKKLKRSYMLHKETIRTLKKIEIEEIDNTLSEIVEKAINEYYHNHYE